MVFSLALLILAVSPGAASVPAEEAAASERLSAQANEFLASMLGPGRGKAVVLVEGEQSESTSQSEISASMGKPLTTVNDPLDLPGYTKDKEKQNEAERQKAALAPTRKTQENSRRETGLEIKRMRVSVVLDTRVTQDQVTAVTNLLPQFLHVDRTRGDEVVVLRADINPNWKVVAEGYLLSKDGLGHVAVFGGGLVLILIALLLGGALFHVTTLSAVRTFVGEMAQHRNPPFQAQPAGFPRGEGDQELLTGGVPSLAMEGETGRPAAASSDVPLLGQRFDFLVSHSPAELAKYLINEPPAELALLFATLAASHPDVSAAVFTALSPSIRAEVSRALAGLTAADPERLELLESRLKNMVDYGVRGPERLGDILSRMPTSEREFLLNDVVTSNPAVADELQRSLFSFEDITQLKDADFRRLISAVPYADWGLALRGAPQAVIDRVLAELEPGIQGMIKEALESPQPRPKINEARSKILSQTLSMAGKGEIVLQRGQSTEMI
jgi:hypothetical protein